jgi:hypothetical protein
MEPVRPIEAAVKSFVGSLTEGDINGVEAYWETSRGVPPDLDGQLLTVCRTIIDRSLEREEIRLMRTCFQQAVRARRT